MPSLKYVWSKKENEILKKYGSSLEVGELVKKIPNKSKHAIYKQKKLLGIKSADLKKYNWTNKENKILKEFSNKLTVSELRLKLPNKPDFEIFRQRAKLGLKSATEINKWSQKEINLLKKIGGKFKGKDLVKFFPNRKIFTIQRKRKELGINIDSKVSHNSATEKEIQILKENLHLEDKDVQKLLKGRSIHFIRATRIKYKIKKKGRHKPFPNIFFKLYK